MDFVAAIKSGFNNYANFSGVASKAEYWYWVLFIILVNVATTVVDAIDPTGIVGLLVTLGLLVPSVSVLFRRLKDSGHNPLWFWGNLLASIVFIVCLFVFIIALFSSGVPMAVLSSPDQISEQDILNLLADPAVSASFVLTLVTGVIVGVLNIVVQIVFCLQPTKTAEQGNKYVLPKNPMI